MHNVSSVIFPNINTQTSENLCENVNDCSWAVGLYVTLVCFPLMNESLYQLVEEQSNYSDS